MIPQRRGAADVTIARLKVHADRADSVTARLSVERILGAIELRPDSLPPSAILCVRELRDPRPGKVSLASHQLRPPLVWEQAMRREVDRLARAAARPAHGAVPATAEAVVFADDSELLACLASDLVAGVVGACWWWRLLVEGVEQPRRAVIQAWLRAPEHAPAALHVLADRREAEAFVRIFEDRDGRGLVDAIAKAFGLPAVTMDAGTAHRSGPALAPVARPRAPIESTTAAPAVGQASAATELHAVVAPWSAIAPEADRGGLSIDQRALLGAALTIARAPTLARSTEFVTELAAWRMASAAPPRPAVATAPERASRSVLTIPSNATAVTIRLDHTAKTTVRVAGSVSGSETAAVPLAPGPRQATQPTASVASSPSKPEASMPRLSEPISPASSPAVSVSRADGEPPTPQQLPSDAPAAAETPGRSPPAPYRQSATRPRSRAFGPLIQTQLGGVFYLVNLALYLRLYGDDENLPLPLWDFVALVGRALLGDEAAVDDPVWLLLAELAGRASDEPPGAGFVSPVDWRLPPAWLAPFEAVAQYRASPDRLVISHADGFEIVDVEAHVDLALQLITELSPYGGLACTPAADASPLVLPADKPLDRWLAWLLPYLRARLRRVLAVDDTTLPALLLAYHARVHVTDTHLDIVLPLDTLPIEIRFAGLDRDPGWVAAAGRYIAFHFE